jgi:hypothetical protein
MKKITRLIRNTRRKRHGSLLLPRLILLFLRGLLLLRPPSGRTDEIETRHPRKHKSDDSNRNYDAEHDILLRLTWRRSRNESALVEALSRKERGHTSPKNFQQSTVESGKGLRIKHANLGLSFSTSPTASSPRPRRPRSHREQRSGETPRSLSLLCSHCYLFLSPTTSNHDRLIAA